MSGARVTVVAVAVLVLAGCGGGSEAGSDGLRDGVYAFELTEEYLLENGIAAEQARDESGAHELTLDGGRFIDRWRTEQGGVGSCWGTYSAAGTRVTFRFRGGCIGDWAMTYSLDGDVVTWSDIKALDPGAGPEEQAVTEVFNGVPWTRTGDVPEEGAE